MIIKVKVRPGAKEDSVVFDGNKHVISVKDRAEKGKANHMIAKLLLLNN